MRNSEYWRKRFEQLTESELNKADQYREDLEREYGKAIAQLQKDIDVWYARFAKDNSISLAEAKRLLNSRELEEFRWTVQDYIRYGEANSLDGKWIRQLKNASARVHISRLESIQLQLQQHAEVVFGNQLDALDSLLRDIYESGYYHSIFEVQRGVGIGSSFAILDTERINQVLSKPWTNDGIEFSGRIWNNRARLVNALHTGLTQALIRGSTPDGLIRNLVKQFDTSKHRAGLLVQSESAYFANEAQLECFRGLDVDKVIVVGTLDGHTCGICADMDGRVISLKDARPGVTTPIYHAGCRCCTAPHFDDIAGGRAARSAVDDKTYYVPSDMTYHEWYKKYVVKRK